MGLICVLAIGAVAVMDFEFAPLLLVAKFYMYAAFPLLFLSYMATEQRALLSAILIAIFIIALIGSIGLIVVEHQLAIYAKWVLFVQLLFVVISTAIWNRNTKESEEGYQYQFKMVAGLLYFFFVGFIMLITDSFLTGLYIGAGIPVAILIILIIVEVVKALVSRKK